MDLKLFINKIFKKNKDQLIDHTAIDKNVKSNNELFELIEKYLLRILEITAEGYLSEQINEVKFLNEYYGDPKIFYTRNIEVIKSLSELNNAVLNEMLENLQLYKAKFMIVNFISTIDNIYQLIKDDPNITDNVKAIFRMPFKAFHYNKLNHDTLCAVGYCQYFKVLISANRSCSTIWNFLKRDATDSVWSSENNFRTQIESIMERPLANLYFFENFPNKYPQYFINGELRRTNVDRYFEYLFGANMMSSGYIIEYSYRFVAEILLYFDLYTVSWMNKYGGNHSQLEVIDSFISLLNSKVKEDYSLLRNVLICFIQLGVPFTNSFATYRDFEFKVPIYFTSPDLKKHIIKLSDYFTGRGAGITLINDFMDAPLWSCSDSIRNSVMKSNKVTNKFADSIDTEKLQTINKII